MGRGNIWITQTVTDQLLHQHLAEQPVWRRILSFQNTSLSTIQTAANSNYLMMMYLEIVLFVHKFSSFPGFASVNILPLKQKLEGI